MLNTIPGCSETPGKLAHTGLLRDSMTNEFVQPETDTIMIYPIRTHR